MKRALLACAVLALGAIASAQPNDTLTSGGELIPEQACYDVLHYDLTLEVLPATQSIRGKLTMRANILEPGKGFVVDLDDRFEVTGVKSAKKKLEFKHVSGRIRIETNSFYARGGEVELTIDYSGKPRVAPRPPWDGGFTWAKTRDGLDWIATSCQAHGADIWWPCKDHPSDKARSMDLRITVPAPLVVASNGKLIEVTEAKKRRSYHWRISNPFSNYVIALNIGPYETLQTDFESVAGDSFPVTYWYLPQNAERSKAIFPQFLEHLKFFEELFGPYPFRVDKYGVAETPHLGMEHQTVIAYGGNYGGNPWGEDRGFDFLHHHELAHEWWANLVTARDWKDFWIHESFATYAQALYTERLHGAEAYRSIMAETREQILNRGAVAPRTSRTTNEMYFAQKGQTAPGADIYYKGSWVLHSLRWVIGDKAFFSALRRMAYPDPTLEALTDGSQCRLTDTEEIRKIAEETSGRKLGWFFDVYLRQPELPKLVQRVDGGKLLLSWSTPGDLPFPMPVPVHIGDGIRRVEMPSGKGSLRLVSDEAVRVDPHNWILKK